jgi:ribosomal-protein-alanine N-acetyltransferase
MVGTCGFTSFNCSSDSAEVGYVLNPEYWGKGIATEALTKVLEFGFDQLKLHRIEAKFIKENERSRQKTFARGIWLSVRRICVRLAVYSAKARSLKR